MLTVEPSHYARTSERVAQLIHDISYRSNASSVVRGRLRPLWAEPALELANRHSEQFGQFLLRDTHRISGLDQDIADRRAIVIGPTLHYVAQRVAKLLQRNTDIAPLLFVIVVTEGFLCAKRRSPERGCQVRVSLQP